MTLPPCPPTRSSTLPLWQVCNYCHEIRKVCAAIVAAAGVVVVIVVVTLTVVVAALTVVVVYSRGN